MEGGLRYWGPSFFGGFFAYRVCGIPPAPFAKGETQSGEKKGPEFCVR